MFKSLREDVEAVFQRDPAARSRLEVALCYPGIHAVGCHRVAHALWVRDWKLADPQRVRDAMKSHGMDARIA